MEERGRERGEKEVVVVVVVVVVAMVVVAVVVVAVVVVRRVVVVVVVVVTVVAVAHVPQEVGVAIARVIMVIEVAVVQQPRLPAVIARGCAGRWPGAPRGIPRAHGIMRNTAGRQRRNVTAIRRITMFFKRTHISRWPGCRLLLRRIGQKPGRPRGPPAPGVPLPAVRWRVFP